MPTCDICGAEVTLKDYCKIGIMPNPIQPKGWFLLVSNESGESEKVSDTKPAATEIAKKLGEIFSRQASIRESKTETGGPANLPGMFVSLHGKLYFCHDCVAANGGKITKTGVAFVKGKAKKKGKSWWPF